MAELVVRIERYAALILAVLNLFFAAMLLFCPNIFSRVNNVLNKRIKTENFEIELNKYRDIDPDILKSRKIIGYVGVIVAVVLFFMYTKYR